ncbi:hypothetical protein [Spirosoma areae]
MNLPALINARVLATCFALLFGHFTVMAYTYGLPKLARMLLYALVLLTLITLVLFLIRPAQK